MDTVETDELDGGLLDLGGEDEPELAVYEVGYHLVPSIAEEKLPETVIGITDFLKSQGAEFVGERFPSHITLAYPLMKRIAGKRTNFDTAYFGWVAFEVGKATIDAIKTFLDKHQDVVRYLIVRTDRDAVHAAMSGAVQAVQPVTDIGKPKRDMETGGEVSEAALEEALKTIETEDSKAAE